MKISTHGNQDDPRCYGNACSAEPATLDAFGDAWRTGERCYEMAAPGGVDRRPGGAVYSARLMPRSPRRKAPAQRPRHLSLLKVKVGHAGDDDATRLRLIRRWIGPRVDLRIDANGVWRAAELRHKLRPLLASNVSSVEQPVAHEELAALAELRGQIGVSIMLDESLASELDGRRAIEVGACDLFNIRLSKCGGYLASLRMAAIGARPALISPRLSSW
jgi:muconate cycloisomerase